MTMKEKLSKENLISLLSTKGEEEQRLFERAALVKKQHVGNKVYLRGLIELSNRCQKDCFYCGIRRSNRSLHRYMLSHEETMEAVMRAYEGVRVSHHPVGRMELTGIYRMDRPHREGGEAGY